jgi:hypothetical protein
VAARAPLLVVSDTVINPGIAGISIANSLPWGQVENCTGGRVTFMYVTYLELERITL